MGDITHDHLNAIAARLEASFQREADNLREDISGGLKGVHARVGELRDSVGELRGTVDELRGHVIAQDARVTKLEMKATLIERSMRMARFRAPSASASSRRSSKMFVAGVVAAIATVIGAFSWVISALREYLPPILKALSVKP
jgi:hypothetical protein